MYTENTAEHSSRSDGKPSRYDLNWQLCNKELESIKIVSGLGQKHIAHSFSRFAFGTLRSCTFLFRSSIPDNSKILFFVSSRNQYEAFKPFLPRISGASVIEICNPFSRDVDRYFPLHKAYFRTISTYKRTLEEYRANTDPYIDLAYHTRGDLLALAPGLLETALSYLERLNPKVLVVSNDLVLWPRSIIAAAKQLNIKTVYLQHACVPKIVPPLEVDYAFLDGIDAAEKYVSRSLKGTTKIYLSGGARHDAFVSLRQSGKLILDKKIRVGICVNMVDDLQGVHYVAKTISDAKKDKVSISIRAHPREHRIRQLKTIAKTTGSSWSDPLKQSAIQFIEGHDTIIAGDSSILFDAALSNKNAIKAEVLGSESDYLGLVGCGLAIAAKTDEDLLDSLKQEGIATDSGLKNYYASYSTEWEGKSGELIASAINDLLLKGNIQRQPFKKNRDSSFFELVA